MIGHLSGHVKPEVIVFVMRSSMSTGSPATMKAIKRKPVVLDVANQIRAAILDGGLLPGSKIAQDELAAELAVSRLPIRQALLVLQREGLVFLDHGRGAIVAPLDIKFISDLFDCRAIVDGYVAAALAARRQFDVAVLRQIVRDGRAAARRGESRRDLIMGFHTAQYEALGNQVLSGIMEPLLDHVQRVVTFVQASTSGGRAGRKPRARGRGPGTGPRGLRSQVDTWDEHAEIVEAIARHRAGRARALARSHVERVKQVVIPYLVSAAPSQSSAGERRRAPDSPRRRYPKMAVTFDATGAK
jgi:DNA-binding GntR family transcriptional regulator